MGKTLVFCEFHNDVLKRSALELLNAAKTSGQTVVAALVGAQAADVGKKAAQYGASEVLVIKDPAFDKYNPELFTTGLSELIKKSGATLVLVSASSLGRDVFPRVAARLDAGLVSDCTELSITGDNVTVKRPIYSGKCFAKVAFEDCPLKIVLMRPNQLPVGEANTSATAAVTEVPAPTGALKTLIKDIVKGASEKVDLTEANIIVSGGRGLKEAANFKYLHELADVLGATVGASRAVVDAGWVGHDMQVGQTGKTVAPSLYIAVGISGAIQHLAGMSGSKVIVAINSDANAPIFQKATYGIVGDYAQVLPALTQEFKRVLS
jgi:electron transfer flavoprotein alpha subunit